MKNIKLKLINVLLQNKGPALTLHFLKFNQTFSKFRIRFRKLNEQVINLWDKSGNGVFTGRCQH